MFDAALLFYYGGKISSILLLSIAVVIGFRMLSHLKGEYKWLLYYLAFFLTVELATNLLSVLDMENLIIYPFYMFGEFILLSLLFITGKKRPRYLIAIAVFIAVLIFIEAIMLWHANENVSSGYGKAVSHLLIVLMMGYALINELKFIDKGNELLFVYGSLFLCYTVTLFLFLFLDQLTELSLSKAHIIWGMNNIIASILYTVSLLVFKRIPVS